MGLRKYGEITIRGVTYQDVNAAAQAFGVGADAIRQAARAGRLDRVGMPHGCEPMPVRIRGEDYPDAKAAARALGVTTNAVYQAIVQGREDRLGLPREPVRNRGRQFSIGGMSWPSEAEACRQLGLCVNYIYLARRRRSVAMQQVIVRRAMQLRAERARASGASDFPPACDPVHGRRTAGRPTGAAGRSRRAPLGLCAQEGQL
ncbi:hypothetical protein EOW65_09145 [Sinirhodobacter ferrireducens]|uniref:Nuclease-associated modular DNA-binding 1 domain-containing protein n=1 Tax=Paenirhodobacter ferrireducens TaxID=1215032 RepID=A0A443LJZ5_9RHOB|nr:hypothetical protein [Sinirhodobacter ferrireducens]RWR49433.1 hypothetical protein EOW65_09145 [Sinirhodobacter ferrireducens]